MYSPSLFGPDGSTVMRRDDTGEDGWSALWNGDEAHDVQATGMLSAIRGAARGRWRAGVGDFESWSRPIGWMRPVRCCKRPATTSGANRECRALHGVVLGRGPPGWTEQAGRHQQREQVQRVVHRDRLEVAHHRHQSRRSLRLAEACQRRPLAA